MNQSPRVEKLRSSPAVESLSTSTTTSSRRQVDRRQMERTLRHFDGPWCYEIEYNVAFDDGHE